MPRQPFKVESFEVYKQASFDGLLTKICAVSVDEELIGVFGSSKIPQILICKDSAGRNRKEMPTQVRVRTRWSSVQVGVRQRVRNSWTRKENGC